MWYAWFIWQIEAGEHMETGIKNSDTVALHLLSAIIAPDIAFEDI